MKSLLFVMSFLVAACSTTESPQPDLSSSADLSSSVVSCGAGELSVCAALPGHDNCGICSFAAGADPDAGMGICATPCSTMSLNPSGACPMGRKCTALSDPARTIRTQGCGTTYDGYCK